MVFVISRILVILQFLFSSFFSLTNKTNSNYKTIPFTKIKQLYFNENENEIERNNLFVSKVIF